jgi:phosphopantetheinyl transferase (holo-ACP synthase)
MGGTAFSLKEAIIKSWRREIKGAKNSLFYVQSIGKFTVKKLKV